MHACISQAAPLQAMSQARFTITGTACELPEGEQEAAKQLFLARNPNSFWVNFGVSAVPSA